MEKYMKIYLEGKLRNLIDSCNELKAQMTEVILAPQNYEPQIEFVFSSQLNALLTVINAEITGIEELNNTQDIYDVIILDDVRDAATYVYETMHEVSEALHPTVKTNESNNSYTSSIMDQGVIDYVKDRVDKAVVECSKLEAAASTFDGYAPLFDNDPHYISFNIHQYASMYNTVKGIHDRATKLDDTIIDIIKDTETMKGYEDAIRVYVDTAKSTRSSINKLLDHIKKYEDYLTKATMNSGTSI